MMRLQYENLMTKIFEIVNNELDGETHEAKVVYKRLSRAMFDVFYKKQVGIKQKESDKRVK